MSDILGRVRSNAASSSGGLPDLTSGKGPLRAEQLRAQAKELRKKAQRLRETRDGTLDVFSEALAREDENKTTADRIKDLTRGTRRGGTR